MSNSRTYTTVTISEELNSQLDELKEQTKSRSKKELIQKLVNNFSIKREVRAREAIERITNIGKNLEPTKHKLTDEELAIDGDFIVDETIDELLSRH